MTVLRVYDPVECDSASGVPLDWERCHGCGGSPEVVCSRCEGHGSLKAAALALRLELVANQRALDAHVQISERVHASLPPDAFAAAEATDREFAGELAGVRAELGAGRCEDCCHPMSDGSWMCGGRPADPPLPSEGWIRADATEDALGQLRDADPGEPRVPMVHWSPCDERCTHGGSGTLRWKNTQPDDGSLSYVPPMAPGLNGKSIAGEIATLPRDERIALEASWRQVEVRTLGWAHDLRPEKLAVLCLRCFAARTSAEAPKPEVAT